MASTSKIDANVYWGVIAQHGNSARFSMPKSEIDKEAILIVLPDNQYLKDRIIESLVEKEPEEA
ncbi:DUF2080 family transposase-associated protein [Methanococcus voltae]|uniref:Uncharacterized protein n=2 Tax=Methanococcus voltae TaxID=2188 RepID=D7DSM7_METV3|nr:DUF2080 family transposase-associated protein [Methanococcus voltae]MBP2173069.1 putative transposon-encoded protein [Methanococcus voltae]MCS3901736.1 putative transposon-encoded protein [Methanococcus voltae]MCS3922039.1 putative transposon-encoded protein [Methanococcus voltae PS]